MRKTIVVVQTVVLAGSLLLAVIPAFTAEPNVSAPAVQSEQKADVPLATKADTKPETKEVEAVDEHLLLTLKVPITSPLFTKVPVAVVNDEQITVNDLLATVSEMHTKVKEGAASGKGAFSEPLKRLINAKLLVQEARNVEFDQLPEVKADLRAFSAKLLREMLYRQYVAAVKVDEKELEIHYNEMRKEWKVTSVKFKKEEDAKRFEEELKAGKNFAELRDKVVKEGIAEAEKDGKYLGRGEMDPAILPAVVALKVGSVSPIIAVPKGYLLCKLEEMRSADNPELKERIRKDLASRDNVRALEKAKRDLIKKYAKQNEKLIKSIDLEAKKPGIEKLAKDKRVLVTVKGEQPITVANLVAGIAERFVHGLNRAIDEKKANSQKMVVLDELMARLAFNRGALDLGLDKTEEYRKEVEEYEKYLLFGLFIDRVIKPDVKIKQEDLKAYYDAHIQEFTYPEMLKIEEVVFTQKEDAENAATKLNQGMDLKWLKSNADRQADKDAPLQLHFGGEIVTTKSLPEDLQKALAGVKADEYRPYAGSDGYFYVLHVLQVIPSRVQPLEEVQEDIAKPVYNELLNKAVDEWFGKLREASDVKIYLD
jgi:parvulin-like peptidyl-prolyl isomerase